MTRWAEAVARELAACEGATGRADWCAAAAEAVARLLDELGLGADEASGAVGVVAAVVQGLPLTPLTGEDWEWERVDEVVEVNVRCPRVKRELGVGVYDEGATVFVDDEGTEFLMQPQSRRAVKFPYLPVSVRVRVGGRFGGRRSTDPVN